MSKIVRFYFVRHGHTELNKQHLMQGWTDSPLTPEGLPVLEEDAKVLKDVHFDRCFASPTGRTMRTAEIILGDRELPIEPVDGLKEVYFGKYELRSYKEDAYKVLKCYIDNNYSSANGESEEEIKKRVRRTMRDLFERCEDGDTVLLVSHGDYCRNVLMWMFDLNYKLLAILGKLHAGNGDMMIFDNCDGVCTLKMYPGNAKAYTRWEAKEKDEQTRN